MLLEFELKNVPQALRRSQQRYSLMVFRITDAGVTFYMMDVDDGPASSLNRADGQLFVPMSSVISINTFGRIEPSS